ncbi:hypothetical protein ABZV31_04540 [Streptomyces sp. NPDC005202]|uniref:hypothetical protein n=1 Tax=Streptomyces sp. NPDC005202 TaxID=3157021 RepID=UPI0033AD7B7D
MPYRLRVPGPAFHPAPIQHLHPCPEFRAAGGRAFVVVPGPGEVEVEGVGLLAGSGRGEAAAQLRLAFGRVPLLAEHDVEAVAEGVPAAGPGVVRGERGGVQGAGPFPLRRGGRGPVFRGQVLQSATRRSASSSAGRAPPTYG